MRLNIVSETAVTLTGLSAVQNIKAVQLRWNTPTSQYFKHAEVWRSATSSLGAATLIGTTVDAVYDDPTTDTTTRYYWVRAVNTYDRADGPWLGPITGAGKLVTSSDVDGSLSGKGLDLKATGQVFQISKSGSVPVTTISLTAIARNLGGTPNWTVPTGSATLTAGADSWSKNLTYANMGSDSVTIKVAQDGLEDTITIVKVREGQDGSNGVNGLTGLLTNEAFNISADYYGNVSSYAGSGGTFKVYDGITDMTGNASVNYSVASQSGISATISNSGVYGLSGMTSDTATVTFRANYKGVNIDKVYSITKAKNGLSGSPGSNGKRGTIDIVVAGSGWSDATADGAVYSAANNSWPIRGDRVTITGGANGPVTKAYINGDWPSGQWIELAAYINGNMVVTGTFSADKISGGTFTGASINIGSGKFSVNSVNGLVNAYNFFGYNSNFGNLNDPNTPAISAGNTGLSSTTVPTARFTTSTGGPAVKANGSSSGAAIEADGIIIQSAYSETQAKGIQSNNIIPVVDNTYNCGTLTRRWMGITTASAVVVSSDQRIKTAITDSDLGLSFINSLRPVKYKMKEGKKRIERIELEGPGEDGRPISVIRETVEPGKRFHYGLLSQQVREQLVAFGSAESAIWALEDPDDPESAQGLRYEALISPLIKAIQELSAEVVALRKLVDKAK